jgi:uncharacterized protein (TIGR02246 family)
MALSLADKVEIQELIARYNRAIDTGEPEEWAATFTADGEFHGIVGDFNGTRELTQFARDYWSKSEYEEFRKAQHWVTNVVVDGDGHEARLFAHLMMVKPEGDGAAIILLGWYDDELRRVDGRWRFAARNVHVVVAPAV